jgi:hypothetical protein
LRWLRREAIDLGDLLVQIIAVVVGILLALLINNWVTQRQQQATVDEAMRAIRAELMLNRADLRSYGRHMFDMAAAMQNAAANKNQPPKACYLWEGWNGIGGLAPIDAAYQTSIATQALANMPFEQAQLVAQVYGWQHYVLKGIDLDASLLMQQPHSLEFCAGVVEEIGRNAVRLDERYAKLIGPDPDAPSASATPATSTKRNPP